MNKHYFNLWLDGFIVGAFGKEPTQSQWEELKKQVRPLILCSDPQMLKAQRALGEQLNHGGGLGGVSADAVGDAIGGAGRVTHPAYPC